ncbi:unnamed protein product [Closterium sp. Naga37s-1]|nr:unnamed protein product [Closterium sp. Naga37s-1]
MSLSRTASAALPFVIGILAGAALLTIQQIMTGGNISLPNVSSSLFTFMNSANQSVSQHVGNPDWLASSASIGAATDKIRYNTDAEPVESKLNVHLVAHSHDDLGWTSTIDKYYVTSVQYIIETVIDQLETNPDRKFIQVEQAFFYRWWQQQKEDMRKRVRALVASGQLEFVNGGWVMHDEATTHYTDMVHQMSLGLRFLRSEFNVTPRIAWQIDPFGHSATQASLITAQAGFDGIFFSRADYQDVANRQQEKKEEFVWRASKTFGKLAQVFGGHLYWMYDPPPGLDCEDINSPPFVQDDPQLGESNVRKLVDLFVERAWEQAKVTRSNHVMFTMGKDFAYSNAIMWFKNMDKLIHYVNLDGRVNALYSTPSIYLDAKQQADEIWPVKTGDFFPYADAPHAYWTGFYSSRPAFKRYVRSCSALLLAASILEAAAGREALQAWGGDTDGMNLVGSGAGRMMVTNFHASEAPSAATGEGGGADGGWDGGAGGDSTAATGGVSGVGGREARAASTASLGEAVAVAQHHDAITGTAQQHVNDDYTLRLHRAAQEASTVLTSALAYLILHPPPPLPPSLPTGTNSSGPAPTHAVPAATPANRPAAAAAGAAAIAAAAAAAAAAPSAAPQKPATAGADTAAGGDDPAAQGAAANTSATPHRAPLETQGSLQEEGINRGRRMQEKPKLLLKTCPLLNISFCPPSQSGLHSGKTLVVVAFNPLAWARTEIVRIPVSAPSVIVTDSNHKPIPSQLIPELLPRPVIRAFYAAAHAGASVPPVEQQQGVVSVVFRAEVPPLGYSTFFLVAAQPGAAGAAVSSSDWILGPKKLRGRNTRSKKGKKKKKKAKKDDYEEAGEGGEGAEGGEEGEAGEEGYEEGGQEEGGEAEGGEEGYAEGEKGGEGGEGEEEEEVGDGVGQEDEIVLGGVVAGRPAARVYFSKAARGMTRAELIKPNGKAFATLAAANISSDMLFYSSAESGAYIFKPTADGALPFRRKQRVPIRVLRGPIVEEFHRQVARDVSEVYRVYPGENYAELGYSIGPLVEDGSLGKEVVASFSSSIQSGDVFYTDSNGRDYLERVRDSRPDWTLSVKEPIAGNFYPVTVGAFIGDGESQLSLLVDRAAGAASLASGQLKVMLHRIARYTGTARHTPTAGIRPSGGLSTSAIEQMSREVKLMGWLYKQSKSRPFGHHWARRYFVLRAQRISYFRSLPWQHEIPVKEFDLTPRCRVEDTGRISTNTKELYTFCIHPELPKPCLVGTKDPEQVAVWMQAIRETIEHNVAPTIRMPLTRPTSTNSLSDEEEGETPPHPNMSSCRDSMDSSEPFDGDEMGADDLPTPQRLLLDRRGSIGFGPPMELGGMLEAMVAMRSASTASGIASDGSWRLIKLSNGLRFFEELNEERGQAGMCGSLPCLSAVGTVDAPSDAVFRLVLDLSSSRNEWDVAYGGACMVEAQDGHTDFIHYRFCPLPVIPRPSLPIHSFCPSPFLCFSVVRWDVTYGGARMVEAQDGHTDCIHYRFRPLPVGFGPFTLTARDVCLRRYWQRTGDGCYVVLYQSMEHPLCPPVMGCVRANLTYGGFIIAPAGPSAIGRSVVMHVLQMDAKGLLPMCSGVATEVHFYLLSRVAGIREFFAQTRGDSLAALLGLRDTQQATAAATAAAVAAAEGRELGGDRRKGSRREREDWRIGPIPEGGGEGFEEPEGEGWERRRGSSGDVMGGEFSGSDAGSTVSEPLPGTSSFFGSRGAGTAAGDAAAAAKALLSETLPVASPRFWQLGSRPSTGSRLAGSARAAGSVDPWAWAYKTGNLARGSPMGGINCWSEAEVRNFTVRSKSYLRDKMKQSAGQPGMSLVAVDWLKRVERIDHVVELKRTPVHVSVLSLFVHFAPMVVQGWEWASAGGYSPHAPLPPLVCPMHLHSTPCPLPLTPIPPHPFLQGMREMMASSDASCAPASPHGMREMMASSDAASRPYFFIVNMQVPAAQQYSMVFYWAMDEPPTEASILGQFINGDDIFRNTRFKLIPRIHQGAWVVKRSVGTTPLIIAGALTVQYFKRPDYFEVQ